METFISGFQGLGISTSQVRVYCTYKRHFIQLLNDCLNLYRLEQISQQSEGQILIPAR